MPVELGLRSLVSEQVTEREIANEQAFVHRVYERLEAAGAAAQAVADEGHGRARLGHQGGLVERDAMVYQAAKRIAALDAAREGLVFGRLDLHTPQEARYIGRIGLRDEHREVMLIDWRAPAAAVFYRATPQDPMDVIRRRVLRSLGDKVVGIEDDLLDPERAPADMPVLGDGAMLAELSRARDRTMRSVVATIQREQDEAIRAPLRGVTAISGGPGTGKTVVALHRVAFLLHADRRRFESGGVLVIGPSTVFMHYIERVLPSLGETSVTLRSIGEVVDGVAAQRHDPADVAAIKGSRRMVDVLARAVRDGPPGAPEEFRTFYRDDVLRLDRSKLAAVRRRLLSRGPRYNLALPRVQQALTDALWEQAQGDRARDRGSEEFANQLLGSDAFLDFAASWWPALDATSVLEWLADPARLAVYADGILDGAERRTLIASWENHNGWTIEDIPLIDELRYLLGDIPERQQGYDPLGELADETVREVSTVDYRDASRERPIARTEDDGYAHVLLDEAQDLSPMQWRMVARRGRHASWTIVGDAAQSSWPDLAQSGRAQQEALRDKPVHSFHLSTNYRNSKEIFDLATTVARQAVPEPDLPEAVRETGERPAHVAVAPGGDELRQSVTRCVTELLASVEGTVAVVAPPSRSGEVSSWVADVEPSRLSVLDGLGVKGLEFDGVLVVEPTEIAAETAGGWRTLYVVLTRATRRVTTVSSDDSWPLLCSDERE
jgi:DNA helicase IV